MVGGPLVLRDSQSGSHARILPSLGFNCFEFEAVVSGRRISVLDSATDFADGRLRPSGHGIPLLFPYPNRIRGGKFRWNSHEWQLPLHEVLNDSEGNAIHGLCVDRPWRVENCSNNSATGIFQLSVDAPERLRLWPADFELKLRYELCGTRLRADLTIRNPSESPLPWGFGTHPYFRLPLDSASDISRCTVEASVTKQWELRNCLPTGQIVEIPEEKQLEDAAYVDTMLLDDVYTGLVPDNGVFTATLIDEAGGLQVLQRTPKIFREFVVCQKPGRDMICLEPYTCTTDAINLQETGHDAGLQILAAGEKFQTWFEIEAGMVVA